MQRTKNGLLLVVDEPIINESFWNVFSCLQSNLHDKLKLLQSSRLIINTNREQAKCKRADCNFRIMFDSFVFRTSEKVD
jgi:hypothetical protein